jgi:hypothetical protein
LTPADAGFRAAGFVVLATFMRPIGGWLADRIGGAQVLSWVFGGIAVFSWLLAWPSMIPFTVGALACAALMGLGNGAVFKLVPEHFPKETGTVTGLVGALGGLGGFFPPLLLGVFRDTLGVVWPGFLLLSATAIGLRVANQRVFRPADLAWQAALPQALRGSVDRIRAGAWASLVTLVLAAAIVVGSRRPAALRRGARRVHIRDALRGIWHLVPLRDVDRAAADTTLLAARVADVLRAQMVRPEHGNAGRAGRCRRCREPIHLSPRPVPRPRARTDHVGLHSCGSHHVPAGLGLGSFRDRAGDLSMYRAFVFGMPMQDFPVESAIAFVVFHGLVWSSFLVIGGVLLAFRRRMTDHGAAAVQQFGQDILPLILLFAISMTGLMLTASYTWLKGYAYDFLAILHAVTVIVTLLWLPFGKLFHIFQRPAQLGVSFYQDAGKRGEQQACSRCGREFAPAMMVKDLTSVEQELGFRYELPDASHYQTVCPKCRRALFGLAQGRALARTVITMATVPVDRTRHHRQIRAFPVVDDERPRVDQCRARSAGQDPLLLLRDSSAESSSRSSGTR